MEPIGAILTVARCCANSRLYVSRSLVTLASPVQWGMKASCGRSAAKAKGREHQPPPFFCRCSRSPQPSFPEGCEIPAFAGMTGNAYVSRSLVTPAVPVQ